MSPAVRFVPLDAPFGTCVEGLDPETPLDPDIADALREAMDEAHLLVFDLPNLVPVAQQRIAGVFGPVLDETGRGDGWSLVSDGPGGVIGEGRLLFHSDLAFTPDPLSVLSLYALKVPVGGSPTHFADAVRAAAGLPLDLRRRVEGKHALHIFPLIDSRGDRRFRVRDLDDGAPRAAHPVLWDHPRSGEPVLFVNEMQTDAIVELPEEESETLLAELWERLYDPGNIYSHHWRPGNLVVWDNVAVQHARDDVRPGTGRALRRVPVGRIWARLREVPA